MAPPTKGFDDAIDKRHVRRPHIILRTLPLVVSSTNNTVTLRVTLGNPGLKIPPLGPRVFPQSPSQFSPTGPKAFRIGRSGDEVDYGRPGVAKQGLAGRDRKLIGLDVDDIEQKLARIEQKFDGIEQRFDRIEEKFDRVVQKCHGMSEQLKDINRKLAEIETSLQKLERAKLPRTTLASTAAAPSPAVDSSIAHGVPRPSTNTKIVRPPPRTARSDRRQAQAAPRGRIAGSLRSVIRAIGRKVKHPRGTANGIGAVATKATRTAASKDERSAALSAHK
ncbi:hypothetical protein C8Q76DRAFT_694893 [Earliella scabrosa]|nr:hypothetical protein C8Q76DRAFT_694893 [Earliella scabrosa]